MLMHMDGMMLQSQRDIESIKGAVDVVGLCDREHHVPTRMREAPRRVD